MSAIAIREPALTLSDVAGNGYSSSAHLAHQTVAFLLRKALGLGVDSNDQFHRTLPNPQIAIRLAQSKDLADFSVILAGWVSVAQVQMSHQTQFALWISSEVREMSKADARCPMPAARRLLSSHRAPVGVYVLIVFFHGAGEAVVALGIGDEIVIVALGGMHGGFERAASGIADGAWR